MIDNLPALVYKLHQPTIVVKVNRVDRTDSVNSTRKLYYLPTKLKWYTYYNLKKRLSSPKSPIDYLTWECKYVFGLSLDNIGTYKWAEEVIKFRYPMQYNFPETREYIINCLMRDVNYELDIFILKNDLISEYYSSRMSAVFQINYDFSNVPDILKSPRDKFLLKYNEKYFLGQKSGKYITNYYKLIKEKEDVSDLQGLKINIAKSLGTDEFISRCKSIYKGNRFDYSKVVYRNNRSSVIIYDTLYKQDFLVNSYSFMTGSGSPFDHISIGEKLIIESLNRLSIPYKNGVRFDNLIKGRNSNTVIIDFTIEYNNKIYWIEYNGEQHYEFVKYFHTKEEFILQKERDNRVREYCKINSIILLEIPYTLNTIDSIYLFLDKTINQGIDPNTLIDYNKLYK